MARFLKQSLAQTCLKETDNGKSQQFNYSRSLTTNWGTVERGNGRIAKNYYAPLQARSHNEANEAVASPKISKKKFASDEKFIIFFSPSINLIRVVWC